MSLYVVRHGQTHWNKEGKIQGSTDIELNETGIEQAKSLKEELKDKDIDLAICSTLKRAMKTAELATEGLGIPIIYDDAIVERNFGILEGKIPTGDEFEHHFNYYKDNLDPTIESMHHIVDRVWGFLDRIKEKYKSKNILLVTHGGVIREIDAYFNGGIPKDGHLPHIGVNNCEIIKYEF